MSHKAPQPPPNRGRVGTPIPKPSPPPPPPRKGSYSYGSYSSPPTDADYRKLCANIAKWRGRRGIFPRERDEIDEEIERFEAETGIVFDVYT